MGRTHAYCIENLKYYYDDIDDAQSAPTLYGVCSSNYESAERYARRYGVKRAFSDFSKMASCPDIDVIDICTPNVYHFDQIMEAIDSGKNIYCEKPLCISSEQAYAAAEAARRKGVICGVVFNTRYHLPVMRAKELISSGRLGEILSFSVSFLHSSALDADKTGWKQDFDICGGGVLFDLGSHSLDMVYYLIGEYDSLSAKSQIAFERRRSFKGEKNWETNADEAFYILCKMKCKAVGNITVGKIFNGTNDDFSFEIYGTKGSVRFSLMEPNWLYFYDAEAPDDVRGFTRIECVGRFPSPSSGFPGQKAPVGWIRSHVGSMYNYLDCVKRRVPPSPSFDDAAYIQFVMERAYKADSEGRWLSAERFKK